MKVNKQTVLLIIIACLAAYSIFQGHGIKTDVAGYNAKIDSIQNEIDSIQDVNTALTQQIVTIDKEIDKVGGDINNVTKNITIIKKQTNEKIDSVDNYNFSDLGKFFLSIKGTPVSEIYSFTTELLLPLSKYFLSDTSTNLSI